MCEENVTKALKANERGQDPGAGFKKESERKTVQKRGPGTDLFQPKTCINRIFFLLLHPIPHLRNVLSPR